MLKTKKALEFSFQKLIFDVGEAFARRLYCCGQQRQRNVKVMLKI
jgi:hypothetical protein